MEEFNIFLLKLFKQLSTGDFKVKVENDKNKLFDATVIGYSEEYESVRVKFDRDDLTKPEYVEVKPRFMSMDEESSYELKNVPIKTEDINYKSIILQ